MKKRVVAVVAVPLLILLVVAGCGSGTATTTTASSALQTTSTTPALVTYSADLSGKSESPAVATSASGSVSFTLDQSGTTMAYILNVTMLTGVTVARVHVGKAGTTGGTILTVFPGPTKKGLFSGVLAQGSFDATKLTGTLKGKTIADFVALIKTAQMYVNVGTSKHPSGELRGQLQ
jgi:hypothetical protein